MDVWLQNLLVAVVVVAAFSWVIWNVILPRPLRDRLAGRPENRANCSACCGCGTTKPDKQHEPSPCTPPEQNR